MAKRRGIHEWFQAAPRAADREVFGRTSDPLTRRGFVTGLGTMTALLGAEIAFHPLMPAGLIPAAFAQSGAETIPGKDGLTLLNDRPLNAETPPHLLDDRITPASRLFVRNNGMPPVTPNADTWTLQIGGESARSSTTLSIAELKRRYTAVSLQLTLECGGNGRAEFYPPASGNQWTLGAVGCPEWQGVRLADVLDDIGMKEDAVYLAYYAADTHLSGDASKPVISRGVPIAKAMEAESLIAFGMNGEDLPALHGYPLRLVFGGWPGSTSGKWLNRLAIRNQVHDGPKMTGKSYRVPCSPVKPGEDVPDEAMCIIESMPVKSLITRPRSTVEHSLGKTLEVGGHAWAGDRAVREMAVSIDFGATWQKAELETPANRLAWQHWSAAVEFPKKGYYEVWARATDEAGVSQPMVVPGWNPKGYLNNAAHRIAVYVV